MTTFNIPTAVFTALQHTMATKDARYYLCGILLDGTQAVGTDGHVMAIAGWDGDACPRIIIPADAVKVAAKAKGGFVTLEDIGDGRYLLAGVAFTPVDGHYPDWKSATACGDASPADCAYNPDIIGKVNKAASAAGKALGARHTGVTFRPIGQRAMPWTTKFSTGDEFRLSGVVMPLRDYAADPIQGVERERA